MKSKNKRTLFVLSITETSFKAAKCLVHNSKRQFQAFEIEALPAGIDDKNLIARLKTALGKLEFNNNHLILCLPRHQATCRHLRIPSSSPREIEKIVSLQAARHLPYPPEELITGFQTILTDKENYCHVNLVIVHRNVIERYINILKELNVKDFSIVLGSYGLSNIYGIVNPQDSGATMVIDLDAHEAESAIIYEQKLVFSRYFKINQRQPGWEDLFTEEINKTRDAYIKEVAFQAPKKILILGEGAKLDAVSLALSKRLNAAVELLPFVKKLGLEEAVAGKVLESENSLSSLIGLGAQELPESLSLLTLEVKSRFKKIFRYKERLRVIFSIAGLILLWVLIITKGLDNKARYLARLKQELAKVSQEAGYLEEAKMRISLLENSSQERISGLEVLFQLHKILPPAISLVNLTYEEDNQVVLRGRTPELNTVFTLVQELEENAAFSKLKPKVRYATSRQAETGAVVDFEIVCLRK